MLVFYQNLRSDAAYVIMLGFWIDFVLTICDDIWYVVQATICHKS